LCPYQHLIKPQPVTAVDNLTRQAVVVAAASLKAEPGTDRHNPLLLWIARQAPAELLPPFRFQMIPNIIVSEKFQ